MFPQRVYPKRVTSLPRTQTLASKPLTASQLFRWFLAQSRIVECKWARAKRTGAERTGDRDRPDPGGQPDRLGRRSDGRHQAVPRTSVRPHAYVAPQGPDPGFLAGVNWGVGNIVVTLPRRWRGEHLDARPSPATPTPVAAPLASVRGPTVSLPGGGNTTAAGVIVGAVVPDATGILFAVDRDFLKSGLLQGMSVDNSRRDVCNRGLDPLIGLDGVSSHAHDPATHRQRVRRLLRAIR